jgi:DNA-binding NarL/FixJ family response regulator
VEKITVAKTRIVRMNHLNNTASIFIVDDHPLVRSGFRQLIANEPDLDVCCEAAGIHEALKLLENHSPDLSIIDISLEDGNGLELIKRIHAHYPEIRMLVVSMHDESLFAERALRAGAMGYVNKQQAADQVIDAIRQVLKGSIYLSPQMTEQLLRGATGKTQHKADSSVYGLSNRELQVFELIGKGISTSQIAGKLHLSIKTIETHRANIKKKLGLHTANELSLKAIQWSLQQI